MIRRQSLGYMTWTLLKGRTGSRIEAELPMNRYGWKYREEETV